MSLSVRSLRLGDFRNYESCHLSGLGSRVIFYGPNASGKTNIVEALQLCTGMSSFRHPRPSQLVRMGASRGRACASLVDGKRELEISLDINENGRRYELNGKPRTSSSLKGLKPVVVFTPDDLGLVKGSSSVRRKLLDALGSQVSVGYKSVLGDYEKLVKQKNRCLKDCAPASYLAAFDDLLVKVGAHLFVMRTKLIRELEPLLSSAYDSISDGVGKLRLSYVPSWSEPAGAQDGSVSLCSVSSFSDRAAVEGLLSRSLGERREEERARMRSLVGPHADRVGFVLDGADASLFASQGQQRSIVLSLKMAELSLIRSRVDQSPLLLLDDVMSELDERRRRAFVRFVPGDVQTFVTTTNLGYFDKEYLAGSDVVDMAQSALGRSGEDHGVRLRWEGLEARNKS